MTSRGRFVVAAVAVALTLTLRGGALDAIYMKPDLENVPVARLVANLEKELAANPKSPDIHLRLARLYADGVRREPDGAADHRCRRPRPRKPRQEVWFGHEPDVIPRKVEPGHRSELRRRAFSRNRSITIEQWSSWSLQASSDGSDTAWTLEQAGNRPGAIAEYREASSRPGPRKRRRSSPSPGKRFYTEEAARYLIPCSIRSATRRKSRPARRSRTSRAGPSRDHADRDPTYGHATSKTIVDLDAAVPFDADGQRAAKGVDMDHPQAGVARVRRDGQRTDHLRLAALWQRHVLERLEERL